MRKTHIVTWDSLQIHSRTMAKRLLPAKQWKGIIAISRGGLIPGALLARELNIRYVDTTCIVSYDHDQKKETLNILKKARGDGKHFIVVDDLVDTGNTAKIVRKMYPKGYFVTFFAKPLGQPFVDDYLIDISQNTWIEQPWDMGMTFIPPLSSSSSAS